MPKARVQDERAGGASGRGAGFTLVEVLVALAICVGVACAVAATVGVCRRAEASADADAAAAELLPGLYASAVLDLPPPATSNWYVESKNESAWRLASNATLSVRQTMAMPLTPDARPVAIRTVAP